jgi:hypothetical protein
MRIQPRLAIGLAGALFLFMALVMLAGSSQAVDNTTRVDAGPQIEKRVHEGFDVTGNFYEAPADGVDAFDYWWDTDDHTDSAPVDGILNNDRDESGAVFHYNGFNNTGTYAFTFWVNYTDGKLMNSTRLIVIVNNEPPEISPGASPQGVVGSPVTFAVTVTDPDSVESTLVYSWDFDVATDADQNGVPDDDAQSQNKTNIQWTYQAEGTYTAKLTVTDDFGARAEAFITSIISRPPGVCEREVNTNLASNVISENVTVRKLCWASYHIRVTAGRLYSYSVEVSNGIPVFVMVQFGKDQYETYRVKGSTLAFVADWSTVPDKVTSVTKSFRPTEDGVAYITIDNGFLYGIDPEHESSMVVTVEDADRNNLLANIPFFVWIIAAAAGIGVVGFYMARAYIAGAEVRKAEREKAAIENQEKAAAKSELDLFLQNPDEAIQRKLAPPPVQQPVMSAPAPGPAPAPTPRAGPRSAGPQAPAGYVPPPPTPVAPPAPAPVSTGPRGPQPGAGPQPPVAMACPSCQSPTEPGWAVCPHCGANL